MYLQFFGWILRSMIAGLHGKSTLNFVRKCQTFLKCFYFCWTVAEGPYTVMEVYLSVTV